MLLFFPAVWGLLAVIVLYVQFPIPRDAVPWTLLMFVNSVHTSLPIAYSLFFMTYVSREKRKRSYIGLAIIFLLAVITLQASRSYLPLITVIAPTVFVVLSTYHFYRQDLGVCSMYRGLDRSTVDWEKRFERWLICFLAFVGPTLYWLGTGTRYYSVVHAADGPLPFATDSLAALKTLGTVAFLGYLGYQLFWKRNFNMRFVYMGGVFVAFLSMLQPGFFFLPLLVQYFTRIVAHDWIEIAFQGKLLGEELKERKPGVKLRLALYALVVCGITYFFTFSKQSYAFMTEVQEHGFVDGKLFVAAMQSPMFHVWATFYLFASAYHYYIGRYVYDFSSPEFRAKLGFGVKR